jgi:NAD-dependent SIR2 family protein deacetylase
MSNKNEIVTAYTLLQCNSCKEQSKQKFSEGDYVFKEISKCSSCDGQVIIIRIFGEYLTQ